MLNQITNRNDHLKPAIRTIYFAKLREDAIIPTKRDEDVAFDIYPCFDEEFIVIRPHETVKIPTGIASVCDKSYGFELAERSSVGSIGIALRCGIIDSGYRGEWNIVLTNTTDKDFYIAKNMNLGSSLVHPSILYPYEKAIAQAKVIQVPQVEVMEITKEQLNMFASERGDNGFGSTGK